MLSRHYEEATVAYALLSTGSPPAVSVLPKNLNCNLIIEW